MPVRVLLGGHPGPGWGHQDRQRPRPPAAGRGGLASPRPVPARPRSAAPLGRRHPGSACPRPRRQPPAAHPLGRLRPAQETPRGRQRRDRPRAGRLVLVAGSHARLSTPHNCPDEQRRCRQASRSDPRQFYEQSRCRRNGSRSISRPAANSDSKLPSCGNQPAHFRLTTRRHRHARHHTRTHLANRKRRPRRRSRPPLHPAPLTKRPPYQYGRGCLGRCVRSTANSRQCGRTSWVVPWSKLR